MRNECDDLFASLDESIAAVRAAGDGARLQVSHLKCGSTPVWGQAGAAIERLEPRAPKGSMSPPTSTRTPPPRRASRRSCRRRCWASAWRAVSAALGDPDVRHRDPRGDGARDLRLGERGGRSGLGRHPIAFAPSHPDWAGRSLADIADDLHAEPAELAFDALIDDRLDVAIVLHCMSDADVDAIMAVPWIAICTDAEGRRPGHPILDSGRPAPARLRQRTARPRPLRPRSRVLSLETAVRN